MMLKRKDIQFWWKLSTFLIYYYHFKWRGKKQKALLVLFFHFFFLWFSLIYIFSVFVQPVGNIDQELLLFVILFVIMSPAFLRWNLKLQTLIEISRDIINAKCCNKGFNYLLILYLVIRVYYSPFYEVNTVNMIWLGYLMPK